jgi:ABC-type transporter Mla MlaB component
MLRITTQNDMQLLTFRLEGRLAGPWVHELRDCWQSALSPLPAVVHVDLRSVLFVDAAGKNLLIDMVRQGAKLLAYDCQMKAVVAEIETAVDRPLSKSK